MGDLVVWPLGDFVCFGRTKTVADDFKVAIAGPLSHIPQLLVWLLIFTGLEGGNFENLTRQMDTEEVAFGPLLCAQAFYLNVTTLVFNLIVPIYPLDGGRCLAAGLVMCGMSVLNAAVGTAVVGMVLAVALVIWGIIDIVGGSPAGIFTAFMGAWVLMTSYGLLKLARPASGVYGDFTDNLKSHPIFGQDCYQNHGRNTNTTTESTNNNNNV